MDAQRINELNWMLAKFVGVEARSPSGWGVASNREDILLWKTPTPNPPYTYGIYAEWSPCTDHNQMALVEEKLREKGHGYQIIWDTDYTYYCVHILEVGGFNYRVGRNESKLIALALAVEAMVNGEKKESSFESPYPGFPWV